MAKACLSLRHVDRCEVTEMRGLVEKDKVKEFQVTVKIGSGSKINRRDGQMFDSRENLVARRRRTDRLVEVFDACAEPELQSNANCLGMLEEYRLCPRPSAAQQLR